MAEDRPAYETLLDAFVYAPLGAALVLADELRRLADRGRERVEKRVAVARVVGKFAVAEARRRLETLGGDPFGGPSRTSGERARDPQARGGRHRAGTRSQDGTGFPRDHGPEKGAVRFRG